MFIYRHFSPFDCLKLKFKNSHFNTCCCQRKCLSCVVCLFVGVFCFFSSFSLLIQILLLKMIRNVCFTFEIVQATNGIQCETISKWTRWKSGAKTKRMNNYNSKLTSDDLCQSLCAHRKTLYEIIIRILRGQWTHNRNHLKMWHIFLSCSPHYGSRRAVDSFSDLFVLCPSHLMCALSCCWYGSKRV